MPNAIVEKSSGDQWEELCSAEGWPVPKVDWYRGGASDADEKLLISSDTIVSDELPFVVKHHRHLNASARLVIKNVTQDTLGVYTCVINGKMKSKSLTLKFSQNKQNSDSTGMNET